MISYKPNAKSCIIYDLTEIIESKYKAGELNKCTSRIKEINETIKDGTPEVAKGEFTFFSMTVAKDTDYEKIFLIFWDMSDKKTRSLTENQVRLWIREIFGVENVDDEMESEFPFKFRKIGDTEKVEDDKFKTIVSSLI